MSTWPQRTLLYDGSFAGFLTCVGESFRQKIYPFYFLTPGDRQSSLYPLLEIPTDPALAGSIYEALETQVSRSFRRLVTYSFLTCLPQRERHMFDALYMAFCRALPQDLTDDRLLILVRAVRRLVHEARQYKGFVRFADYHGVLVGQIAPENQVLPLLRPHFCRRLPEETFLLHDRTHRQALLYTRHKWKLRPLDHLDLADPSQAERQYQALWQQFYQAAAIPARSALRRRPPPLPQRIRETLPELRADLP